MKMFTGTTIALVGGFFLAASVSANPGLLPKHPGYPAGSAKSPVNGQVLANDQGQTNAVGNKASVMAAGAGDDHTMQNLKERNQRIKKKAGAGRLPDVEGPNMFSDKHVIKNATKMK